MRRAHDKRQAGFTMVEMSVVVIIIGVLASTLISRLMIQKEGQELRRSIQKIENVVDRAERMAIESGTTMVVRFDESNQSLTIEEDEDAAANNDMFQLDAPVQDDQAPQASPADSLGAGWSVADIRDRDGQSEQALEIRFYPDGTAQPKTVQFTQNDLTVTLQVEANGRVTVTRGSQPFADNSEWEAGQLEQRVGG